MGGHHYGGVGFSGGFSGYATGRPSADTNGGLANGGLVTKKM